MSGLRDIGVSRHSKWRALTDLERLGLITIERRPRVPLIHRSFICLICEAVIGACLYHAIVRHVFGNHAASVRHTVSSLFLVSLILVL